MSTLPRELSQRLDGVLPGARVQPSAVPEIPDLHLWLFDATTIPDRLPEIPAAAVAATPPYWALCWPSGRVLAAALRDRPELVRGKTVIDLGAGCGIVALAAARAGAARVIACDVDPAARAAVRENAALNDLAVETVAPTELPRRAEILLAADVLYDVANRDAPAHWRQWAQTVVVTDCRLRAAPSGYRATGTVHRTSVWPPLDDTAQFRDVRTFVAGPMEELA